MLLVQETVVRASLQDVWDFFNDQRIAFLTDNIEDSVMSLYACLPFILSTVSVVWFCFFFSVGFFLIPCFLFSLCWCMFVLQVHVPILPCI